MRMPAAALLLLSSLCLPGPAHAQDVALNAAVKAGVEAYNRGDYPSALQAWRPAAEKGNADAQYNVGQIYKLGRGVPADMVEAEKWYRLAALQGHDLAEANYGMMLFENGKREDAVPWLERAVARGEPRAEYLLGVMLFNGDGVAKDWVRAYALMLRASGSGLEAATRTVAQMDQYIPLADRQAGRALAQRHAGTTPAAESTVSAPPPAPRPPATVRAISAAEPMRPSRTRAPAATASKAAGNWRLQLGAFAVPGNAERLWGQVRSRFPGRQPLYPRSGNLTRLLIGPFPSQAEAEKACGAIKPCVAVQH